MRVHAMADEDQTAAAEDEALDASYKPDAAILDGDEADFAMALGFGTEGSPGADAHATDEDASADADGHPPDTDSEVAQTAASEDSTESAERTGSDESAESVAAPADEDDEEDEEERDGEEALVPADDEHGDEHDEERTEDAPGTAAQSDVDDGEFEEIHPRSASAGIQDMLRTRADEVLARIETEASPLATAAHATDHHADLAASDERLTRLRDDLSDKDRALAAALAELDATHAELRSARAALDGAVAGDDKELEESRVELESVTIERDQLIDQLAATSGQLVQSQRSAEQLEASLRAARGALVPLPEGERALRAEVIGLRGRLDEAGQENVRLASEVASVATELAIATARVEDRQHEIDYHADRVRDLENELTEKDRHVEDVVGRHREALDLATRLQAENTEFRGAQAALEETLQARDLEISAREEHLRVIREGLTTRDTQLIDVKQTLEQERHRIEALEADLERANIEKVVLLEKVASRESRIATLTNTLGQIEEAMGQRLQLQPPAQPALAQAEWTRPAASPSSPRTSAPAESPIEMMQPGSEPASGPSVESASPTPPPAPEAALPAAPEPEPVANPAASVAVESVEPVETTPEDDRPVLREPLPPSESPVTSVPELAPDADPAIDDGASDSTPAPLLTAPPALPPILGRWRDHRLAELEEAESGSVPAFLADRLIRHLGESRPEAIYLRSLGGSLPDAEARLVAALHAEGVEGIRMEVLDVDEETAQARRHRIELACLGEVIDVRVGDLYDWNPDAPCHGILLSDALHFQAQPEVVLDHLSPMVARGALLLFAGRIGAGPVQLSASTLMRLEELWQFLPEPLASAEDLGRPPFRGDDGGSPNAETDPAAALVDRFEAIALVGFGHLADLVVGPSRGFALSDEDEGARQLLDSIVAIDESRGITESLPPRHGVGVFAHGSVGRTDCYGAGWACLSSVFR